MSAPSRPNVVEALARRLSLQILDGSLRPGERLPSVRTLAAEHDVNVSTVQRVLARLSELGLVQTHDRRGVEVCDVARTGGAALWPLRLERATRDPGPALALLRDALAIRRSLAVQVLRELGNVPYAGYQADLEPAIEGFVARTRAPAAPVVELLAAETEVLRELLRAAGRPAVLAIVNDVQAMITSAPALLEAIYREPEVNAQAWRGLQYMLSSGMTDADAIEGIETMLAELDAGTVVDFCRRIGIEP
jgi:DNA-binding FadR family transcriptional regulator